MNIAMPSVGVTYGVHTPETWRSLIRYRLSTMSAVCMTFYWLKANGKKPFNSVS